jgi:hypothetical protein
MTLPSRRVRDHKEIKESELPDFIFILGIAHRSGTNFLCDLLVRHPDCQRVQTIWEDYLLAHADKLQQFVSEVAGCWSPKWDPEGAATQQLSDVLGAACLQFLAEKTREVTGSIAFPQYLVTKTPSVQNLSLVSMFPRVKSIVIVRDGRAVVESSLRSFGWDFEKVSHIWACGAQVIRAAQEQNTSFLQVRYEDLVHDLTAQLTRIFAYLRLDPGTYDFAGAESLPVRGSSDEKHKQGSLHWQGVKKSADFSPLERWSSWTAEQHQRFNAIAAEEMQHFGYDPIMSTASPRQST